MPGTTAGSAENEIPLCIIRGAFKDTCKIALMAFRGNGLTFLVKPESVKQSPSKGPLLH
jgi:hypothetical protein